MENKHYWPPPVFCDSPLSEILHNQNYTEVQRKLRFMGWDDWQKRIDEKILRLREMQEQIEDAREDLGRELNGVHLQVESHAKFWKEQIGALEE